MKFCKDCKYFVPDARNWNAAPEQLRYALCGKTQNPVDGYPMTECRIMRYRFFGGCRDSARWFEPKEPA